MQGHSHLTPDSVSIADICPFQITGETRTLMGKFEVREASNIWCPRHPNQDLATGLKLSVFLQTRVTAEPNNQPK